MAIRETKAERIFKENFFGAISHMEQWGVDEPFDAWHSLCNREDEVICRRTVNAVLKECDKRERELDWDLKHGFEPWKGEKIQRKALRIVRNTCQNWIKGEEDFKAFIAR